MQHLEPGQDFVMTIVKLLVDYPDAVTTETIIDKMGVLIVLKVDERDLGKVIGKHGVTINAIRSLLRVLGAKQDARYSLKVDDGKEQLMQLKRDLAAEGLTRKGKMKYWIRIALPAIALQAGELTEQDFDGVIFDIDFLAAALHGRDITDQGLASDIEGLVRFLDPHIKQLRKKQIPVMLHGQLINEESMIKQSIGWQINGLIVEADSEKMDQTVAFQEQLIGFNLV
jgi:predicted RNA-binding protein YlqC (UPF0109 family)